jgi:predicted PurR-regulated permease PerM
MSERLPRDVVTPLLIALAVVIVLAFQVFRPFLLMFAVAASVGVLLAPVHRRLTKAFGGRETLAAGLLVLVTTIVILVPVVVSLHLLARQALVFFEWIRPHLQPADLERFWKQTFIDRLPVLRDWPGREESRVAPLLSGVLGQIAGMAQGLIQGALTGLTHALFELVLFLLMLFFLLRDGARLRTELRPISPFSEVQERQIFDHLGKTVKGTLQSMIVVPLAQGLVAVIGFLIFGVPSPFVWGAAVALAAMVPILGSPLGWVPACVYLSLTADTWQAVGMLVYGTLLISGIDNVVKPLLLQGSARIHPMLGFLSILGGVLAYGVSGFLVGPVILSLVLSAIRIYRMDVLRPLVAAAPMAPHGIPAESSAEAVSASHA